MRIEAVRWLDSGLALDEGWRPVDHYVDRAKLGRMEVWTVGIVMHEDEDVLILAGSHDPAHDKYLNAQVIARSAVIERRPLLLPVEGEAAA